jgi:sugar lactone lactonase YvrE
MPTILRYAFASATVLTLAVTTAAPPASAHDIRFPSTINLPDGFQPEGIAIGNGPFAYFGSRATGQILKVSLATGASRELSPATGTPSLGMKIDDRGRLFVAGGAAGDARIVDLRSGKVLAHYPFGGAFINDVALTDSAAYFTDSRQAVLYKVSFGRPGSLPSTFSTVPLTGDFVLDPAALNANGIVRTPDGRALILVQTGTGLLFRVDPATGVARKIDVGGATFVNGDGLLIQGRTLYIVQNRFNTVAVVGLDKRGSTGVLRRSITDPRFDVPTAIAPFDGRLYLPNARFSTPPTPTTPYTAVAIRK